MISKRHYEGMAQFIRSHGIPQDAESAAFIRGMASLATYLGCHYGRGRFDRDRFELACGESLVKARNMGKYSQ